MIHQPSSVWSILDNVASIRIRNRVVLDRDHASFVVVSYVFAKPLQRSPFFATAALALLMSLRSFAGIGFVEKRPDVERARTGSIFYALSLEQSPRSLLALPSVLINVEYVDQIPVDFLECAPKSR